MSTPFCLYGLEHKIKKFLDSPDFNQEETIAQQIKLLELQYKHIGELISFAREIQTKGVKTMNFEVFDTLTDLAKYCDVFYIGGTKNGALFGEAVVITNDSLKNCKF